MITRSGAPSAAGAPGDWPIDSRITLPPPKTASSPARPGPPDRSSLDLDEQVGVGQPDAVARRSARTAAAYRARRLSSDHSRRGPRLVGACRPGHDAVRRASGDQRRPSGAMPGSKRTRGAGGHGQPAARARPPGRTAAPRLASAKWKCEPTCTGPVAGVDHRRARSRGRARQLISIDAVGREDLARDHGHRAIGRARSRAWSRPGRSPRPAPRRASPGRPPSRRRG